MRKLEASNSVKYIISILFLFLAAFDLQIPFLPNGVGFSLLVSLFLLPFFVVKLTLDSSYYGKCFLRKASPVFFIFFCSFFFIVLRVLLSGVEDAYFLLSWIKAFFVFTSCLFVFFLFYLERGASVFIGALLVVYVLNALVNFVVGTYPGFFGFLDVFRSGSISDQLGVNPYRNSFLSGSGYYSIGTAYGLMVLLFVFHFVLSGSRGLVFIFSIVLSAVSGFVAARTAFFAMALALLYVFKLRALYFLLFFAVGSFFLFLFLTIPAFDPYKGWMMSFFLLSGDSSAAHLINDMYFWPGDFVFLMGSGVVNDGTFPYTDAGYMQDIVFGGIAFLLLKLSFLFFFGSCFFKKYPLFTSLVLLSILVFHFKGLFVYNNAQGMAALYFIFFYLWSLEDGAICTRDSM